MTYDRAVIKVDLDRAVAVNRGDLSKVVVPRVVVPTSEASGLTWRYTFEAPSGAWQGPGYDDSGWKQGPGVLGTRNTPGASVRTTWDTSDVWLRRNFDLPEVDTAGLLLSVLHDEDAEIFLNGVLAATVKGYTGSYEELAIAPEARATLKPGKNAIAIHCRQTLGGQSIDAGLVELKPPGR